MAGRPPEQFRMRPGGHWWYPVIRGPIHEGVTRRLRIPSQDRQKSDVLSVARSSVAPTYAHQLAAPRRTDVPIYKAPVDDAMFLLNDVFQISRLNNLPGFAVAMPDLIEAVLGEAAKLAEEVMQPVNQSGDEEGCTRHGDGSVTTPTGFREAYRQYANGGWMGISAP